MLIGRTEKKLVSVVIAAGALTAPSAASANGSCARDFTANHACAIKSPARLNGKLGTDNERDYYVFHATKGTKLRIAITDTENPGCLLSMYSDCGSVKAELLGSRQHEIASTAYSSQQPGGAVRQSLSHTLASAGTYYVIVTGSLGLVTPPPGGGNPHVLPLSYTLTVKASPNVH